MFKRDVLKHAERTAVFDLDMGKASCGVEGLKMVFNGVLNGVFNGV